MDLTSLLLELKPLLAEPAPPIPRITALLAGHAELAEGEVVRAFVARSLSARVERAARSLDPRERRQALKTAEVVFPRCAAAKIVRRLYKDPDATVRSAAHGVSARLKLWRDTVIALKRDQVARFLGPVGPGGYSNPTGWTFGLQRARGQRAQPGPKAIPIKNGAALAQLLGVASADELVRFTRPGCGSGSGYVAFEVPKADGSSRTIHAPRAELKRIQRVILEKILAPLPVHEACHGFVAGRSTVTNARPHLGAAVVVKTDLCDFFPSVHYRRVIGFFEQLGYGGEVATLLAGLTTHRPALPDGRVVTGALPQGAPTSPALANLVCRRLDKRLAGLARRTGAVYTRYADDLTFSFASEPEVGLGRFLWWVDQICQQEGFTEHSGKRRIMRRGGQQRVTGLVVNSALSVPRVARRRFRAILENCRRHGVAAEARGREDFVDYLRGFAAYVAMVQPEHGRRLMAAVKELLAKGGEA